VCDVVACYNDARFILCFAATDSCHYTTAEQKKICESVFDRKRYHVARILG
jgi:hypothetical protein